MERNRGVFDNVKDDEIDQLWDQIQFGHPCGHVLYQNLGSLPFILSIRIGKQYCRDICFRCNVGVRCLSFKILAVAFLVNFLFTICTYWFFNIIVVSYKIK